MAKSQDLSPSIALTAFFFLLIMLGSEILATFQNIMRESLTTYIGWQLNEENLKVMVMQLAYEALKIVGPVLGVSLLVAFAVNFMQVGWLDPPNRCE